MEAVQQARVGPSPWLLLIRPPNVMTSAADAVAGMALASGLATLGPANALLISASMALYAGGIVFNDVFDADLDAVERPERPIPSGQVSKTAAAWYGALWLVLAIMLAAAVSRESGALAVAIAMCALWYNRWGDDFPILGPLAMGVCRGLNLLLGVSLVPGAIAKVGIVAVLPILFIFAVTLTSRGEVHGKNRTSIIVAMVFDALLVVGFVGLFALGILHSWSAGLFIVGWAIANGRAKWTAYTDNRPETVMNAVRVGVLSLIPLDAAYVAGSAGLVFALFLMALLPLSRWLNQRFQVT
ncbi:MAG: UbiA-like protein EboC [Myxococcota bacterium]